MLANGDVDAGAGGIVSRSAALASYLRAKAHHETAKQDRDRLHNSVRAHLSLFNCNAEVPVIAHDLVVC